MPMTGCFVLHRLPFTPLPAVELQEIVEPAGELRDLCGDNDTDSASAACHTRGITPAMQHRDKADQHLSAGSPVNQRCSVSCPSNRYLGYRSEGALSRFTSGNRAGVKVRMPCMHACVRAHLGEYTAPRTSFGVFHHVCASAHGGGNIIAASQPQCQLARLSIKTNAARRPHAFDSGAGPSGARATGAGGDNRLAKMWNRREISASSCDHRSHDLHPHPYAA
jgi:hypothetical protein